MHFSLKTREKSKEVLKKETVDCLIIGGGITGAGVAVQTAASGITTALVDMQDFAEGTSSRSTKLVHGGIRYLKNFDVEVVADTVKERATVQRIAPHIPKPSPMLLPIYDEPGSTFSMFSVKVAMDLYDQLAQVTDTRYTNQVLSREEVIKRVPKINTDRLLGGGLYLDYTNNDARLVIENIKQAASDGAHLLSRTKVIGFIYDDMGQISGVKVEDQLINDVYEIHAKVVINTTGPWSDTIRQLDKEQEFKAVMRPTKGVHLVVDRSKLSVSQPTYFDTGRHDGRMVFVIPRENKTYFGTTDTDYTGDLKHPRVTQEDVTYLLQIINHQFPEAQIKLSDIEASWAGLRPLIAENGGSDYNGGVTHGMTQESFDDIVASVSAYLVHDMTKEQVEKVIKSAKSTVPETSNSSISRGSSLEVTTSGLITLAGGKITDYRLMAEGATALIARLLTEKEGKPFSLIDSSHYPVSGGHFDGQQVEEELSRFAQLGVEKGLDMEEARFLANLYGSNMPTVLTYVGESIPGLTIGESASLLYSLNHEMTLTPVDYLLRRTNYLLFISDQLDRLKEPVINTMAGYFSWSESEKRTYLLELEEVINESKLMNLKKEN
ncbi:type 1 glycerol-3-phosphate oxidase [Vagococcus sp. DIV0080]|uniref:Alpha-glycerophosphate oxidase n=1 Tax=Candidatus Vagococcus giribetii TaxID=2230876 RepID=A0ABS3HRX1_9ENTE|nr:type 1 glycerol-3-phosphate oxidase [Vagococcus sp. DIV0080]MBO0476497.1 type 1 glycerol-3-phosphate oxidase [Vagococcus sp. DIV0080]